MSVEKLPNGAGYWYGCLENPQTNRRTEMVWVRELAAAIDSLTEYSNDRSSAALCDARIPEFTGLTDSQVSVLLDLVCHEGTARGFGSWWWE